MTSPYYQAQGGYSDALAGMYDSAGALQLKELEQRYKISKDEIGARMKIAGQESQDRRYGIDAQRDSEREKLAQMREEMERIGIPRMLIEKYVAEKTYEIALSEMTLKRDVFVEESAQAREKLKLDREEMERIGIPRMEIERYVAQQNAEIARGNFGLAQAETTGYYNGQSTLARDQFRSDDEYRRAQADESRRQFNVSQTGYMQQPGQLTAEQRGRYEQIRARDQQLQAAGEGGVSPEERAELGGYEDILSGRSGGSPGQATMDREKLMMEEAERQRRYGLDVSKFGAELASTPDTYFQARRFQGVDVPRLLGGAGAATTDAAGGPTPGVATMGAYLSGQDPYASMRPSTPSSLRMAQDGSGHAPGPQPEGAAAGGEVHGYGPTGGFLPPSFQPGAGMPVPAAPGAPSAAAPLSAQEQARYEQLVARRQQTGGSLDPVDEDELQRFQARMGVGATYNDRAGTLGGGPIDPYGAPIGGGGFQNIDPVSGGSTLPLSTFRSTTSSSPTQSVYGGPAVSASVGPQGYYAPPGGVALGRTGGFLPQGSPYPSQDPRQKQLAALAKALPPSPYDGLNEQDSAALKAMESIYKGGGQALAGGEYERLKSSGRLGFLQSAGRLLGYDPKELESQYTAYRPSQGSSRMAG